MESGLREQAGMEEGCMFEDSDFPLDDMVSEVEALRARAAEWDV